MRLLRFARNDENSRIPKPCVIVRLAFFVIVRLDRTISIKIPLLAFFVIPQLDWGISSQII
ncbi:hypothetical protein [Campylobacter sp.]|uniref:hypothetical protein n=1 Tax=Campylobacter sp. TaxID=205 RepID=UPI002A53B010|nr:hypothetical protein [Campylobacter sp.]MDD7089977.1 hypothetical protein [Campylobacteraceae bacterium]MDY5284391.1 hypothetical protein [Campylobacter sp.]